MKKNFSVYIAADVFLWIGTAMEITTVASQIVRTSLIALLHRAPVLNSGAAIANVHQAAGVVTGLTIVVTTPMNSTAVSVLSAWCFEQDYS